MRKLFLFLLLFGLGLAAIVLLDIATRAPEKPAPPPPPSAGSEPGPRPPPAQEPEGEGQGEIVIIPNGEFRFRTFDRVTGRRDYVLEARDIDHAGGGLYDVTDLVVEFYDVVDESHVRTLVAKGGRIRANVEGTNVVLGDDGRVILTDVVVTQHVGGPLVPIVFSAPRLEGSLEDRVFRSVGDDVVDVTGRGLIARGTGLLVEGERRTFELERGGRVLVTTERGQAVFTTPTGGPIEVSAVEIAGESVIELFAREDARLDLRETDRPEVAGAVRANELHFVGRVRSDDVLEVTRVDATGDVVVTRGSDRFDARRGAVDLTPAGDLSSLRLTGAPHGAVTLTGPRGEPLLVELEGDGPQAIRFEGRTTFAQTGPAVLRAPGLDDLVVRAEDEISGSFAEGGESGTMVASGSVVLTQVGRRLEATRLDGRLSGGEDGRVDVTCTGPTHLVVGEEGDPQAAEIFTSGQLLFGSRGKQWEVPLAEGVRLVTQGEDAFTARADVLRDLDGATRHFTAEGDVTYVGALGKGSAVRVVSRGGGRFELYGVPGTLASFDMAARAQEGLEAASFEALRIDVQPDRVDAVGSVVASVRAIDRTYTLEADEVHLDVPEVAEGEPRPFVLDASVVRRADVIEPERKTDFKSDTLRVTGTLVEGEGDLRAKLLASELVATGDVEAHMSGDVELSGAGERLVVEGDGAGRLETTAGRRVSAWGRLADADLPYELTAKSILFDDRYLEADAPHIFVRAILLPFVAEGVPVEGFTEASGGVLRADPTGVLLERGAHVEGTDATGQRLVVDADTMRLSADLERAARAEGDEEVRAAVHSVEAWGHFVATYADRATATGDNFYMSPQRAVVRGQPATIEMVGRRMESVLIDIDLETFLVRAERGEVLSTIGRQWLISFASVQPVPWGDRTLFVVRNPEGRDDYGLMRAAWGVAWIDEKAWARRGRAALWGVEIEEEPVPPPKLPRVDLLENPFRPIVAADISRYVEQVYLEGDVETLEGDARAGRADAALVDLTTNEGWVQNAEIEVQLDAFGRGERMRVRAAGLRMGADGSLRAKKATLTACSHDAPHYLVEAGGLVLDPRADGGWRVSTSRNVLRLGPLLRVPLPPIGRVVLDEEGDVRGFETSEGKVIGVENLLVGDSARFGTTVGTGFRSDLGPVGRNLSRAAGFHPSRVRGSWDLDGRYLGSRGVLLGVGLELSERRRDKEDAFWLNMYASGINDGGEDKGHVRVAEDDRAQFRGWFRARGRYPLREKEWLDLAISTQSDPGAQSEFYEGDWVRYEQRDNYLHWRKARGNAYFDASVSARVDDFRTVTEELPSAGGYLGATPIAKLGSTQLLYQTTLDVDNLHRVQGTLGDPSDVLEIEHYTEWLEKVFVDGLGSREVLRVDNNHRFEVPFDLGVVGLRATPCLDMRFTAWDQGLDPDEAPRRAGLLGGIELATTFWNTDGPATHNLTPSVRYFTDLAVDQVGTDLAHVDSAGTAQGNLVFFDEVEFPIEGERLDIGLRSFWENRTRERSYDFELRNVRRKDTPEFSDINQLQFLADLRTVARSVPMAMRYDWRYDLDHSETNYFRGAFGFAPIEDLQLEFAYARGPIVDSEELARALQGAPASTPTSDLEFLGKPYFDAFTTRGRFRFTPKWEIEGVRTINLLDSGRLNTGLVLRRFSHDFLVEIGVNFRSGEGQTFLITAAPLLGWERNRLGLLQ